ncbi:hypothetical protein Pan216_18670 [Planctomycetes bacterium Pan216]|uniref:PIN domain-containing protein n=1 Tax=Kolteria novifilia TaxID=2527975 RepID=A0A518B251_9BACT|nr:hypothetical protein Pan216_18670 [Planctomycetes bacterium Pan216]
MTQSTDEDMEEEQIVDTCCLLNLYATGEQTAIFQHLGGIFVSAQIQGEALSIRCVDHDSPPHLVPKEIDLTEAIDAGHITVLDLDGQEEMDSFVRFAQQLDDGEAGALALAKSRGWTVATDDKKARRIAGEEGIRVVGTSEMIRTWAESQGMDDRQVGEVLRRIQTMGRFRPRRADSLYEWWNQMVEATES